MKEYKNMPCSAIKTVGKIGVFEGYASVFNQIDKYGDIILQGAFKNITPNEIKILWQHNPDYPIGKVLELYEDEYGLFLKAQLILSVKQAAEAYDLLKSKSIEGLSIGYSIIDSIRDERNNTRILKSIDLWEVSIVTYPANTSAKVSEIKKINNTLYENAWDRAIKALRT